MAVQAERMRDPDAGYDDQGDLMHEALRMAEALLFASSEPVSEAELAGYLPARVAAADVLARLQEAYALRGVNLVRVAGKGSPLASRS